MHIVVMIVAAILIASFFLSNPGAFGKFVGGFLLGIGILAVFVVIGSVLPDTKSSQQTSVTMSNSEIHEGHGHGHGEDHGHGHEGHSESHEHSEKQADANVKKMLFDFDQRKDHRYRNFENRHQ